MRYYLEQTVSSVTVKHYWIKNGTVTATYTPTVTKVTPTDAVPSYRSQVFSNWHSNLLRRVTIHAGLVDEQLSLSEME